MAADRIELEITTPERLVLAETVDEVVFPAADGYMGVLPGHAPLLTSLQAGELSYRVGGTWSYLSVSTGFVEVLRDKVRVLADTCERADEIDGDRAERARQNALRMLQQKSEDLDIREAGARLRKAAARVAVSHRLR